LLVSPAETRVSVTCQRLAVRRFPSAQNGTCRLRARTHGRTAPCHVSSKRRCPTGSIRRCHTQRPRSLYLGPYGTEAGQLKYRRLVAEFLISGRSPSFGTAQHSLTVCTTAWAPRNGAGGFPESRRMVALDLGARPLRRFYESLWPKAETAWGGRSPAARPVCHPNDYRD
jgi:hypothetical protein